MIVHYYSKDNQNKKATIPADFFSSINWSHSIDDFSRATLSYGYIEELKNIYTNPGDNLYIENDNGEIEFGGVVIGVSVNTDTLTLNVIDHRWLLSKLLLTESVNFKTSDNLVNTVDSLINQALSKRFLPFYFDKEYSDIISPPDIDMTFDIGDDIASCLQKIIQMSYARWTLRYNVKNNKVFGKLIVRSVVGVTPEGVGKSMGLNQNDSGEYAILRFVEGDITNNIKTFNFDLDIAEMATDITVAYEEEGVTKYENAVSDSISNFYESAYGLQEKYIEDFKINNKATAKVRGLISQQYPKLEATVVLNEDYERHLKCGDRVQLVIDTPLLQQLNITSRIDSLDCSFTNGVIVRNLAINISSPKIRPAGQGIINKISEMDTRLDALAKRTIR